MNSGGDVRVHDDVPLEKVYGSDLPWQESRLVQQPCHPIHPNDVLDVLLSSESFVSKLKLLVAIHQTLASARLPTAAHEAAADMLHKVDEQVFKVTYVELSSTL